MDTVIGFENQLFLGENFQGMNSLSLTTFFEKTSKKYI